MNSIKDALGEALKRRKMDAMSKEGDDPWGMPDDAKEEAMESPEEEELEQKSADLAPNVKDKKPSIEIDIKTSGHHNAADEVSDDGKMDDLSTLMGHGSSPDDIARLAGGGRPKSLFEAAAKMLASKKMKM